MRKNYKNRPKQHEMTDAQKAHNWDYAKSFTVGKRDKKYGLFSDKYSYYLSEKKAKRREESHLFLAAALAMRTIGKDMTMNALILFFIISDMKYFEQHVIRERTGWAEKSWVTALKELIRMGYVEEKKPEHEFSFYQNKRYVPKNKYYTTAKYEARYRDMLKTLKDINQQYYDSLEENQ